VTAGVMSSAEDGRSTNSLKQSTRSHNRRDTEASDVNPYGEISQARVAAWEQHMPVSRTLSKISEIIDLCGGFGIFEGIRFEPRTSS